MKMLSSFTHPYVVANLYEFFSPAEHKEIYFEEWLEPNSSLAPLTSRVETKNTMEVNGAPQLFGSNRSSKYIPLCSAEVRNSYRFATTWGWVNDDRIFIFGWSIPLKACCPGQSKPSRRVATICPLLNSDICPIVWIVLCYVQLCCCSANSTFTLCSYWCNIKSVKIDYQAAQI